MPAMIVKRLCLHFRACRSVTAWRRGGSRRPALRALAHRRDEVGNARGDFGAETRAVEHAVMTDARLQPMRLPFGRKVDAQPVRRFGLPDAGNIVVFAFDGQQRHAPDLLSDRPGGRDASSRPCGSAWRTNTVSTVCR